MYITEGIHNIFNLITCLYVVMNMYVLKVCIMYINDYTNDISHLLLLYGLPEQ